MKFAEGDARVRVDVLCPPPTFCDVRLDRQDVKFLAVGINKSNDCVNMYAWVPNPRSPSLQDAQNQ